MWNGNRNRIGRPHNFTSRTRAAGLFLTREFFSFTVGFCSNKNSSELHFVQIHDGHVSVWGEESPKQVLPATALIDRWRGAKRNYRDNTPEHSAPVCPGKGIKLVERSINVSLGRDGGWNLRLYIGKTTLSSSYPRAMNQKDLNSINV